MKCPYCQKEMKKGALYSQSFEMAWFPEGKRPPKLGAWSANGISVGGKSMWRTGMAVAYYCADCKKIMIDMDE